MVAWKSMMQHPCWRHARSFGTRWREWPSSKAHDSFQRHSFDGQRCMRRPRNRAAFLEFPHMLLSYQALPILPEGAPLMWMGQLPGQICLSTCRPATLTAATSHRHIWGFRLAPLQTHWFNFSSVFIISILLFLFLLAHAFLLPTLPHVLKCCKIENKNTLSEQFPALMTFLHRNMETHTCENHPTFAVLLKRLEKVVMAFLGKEGRCQNDSFLFRRFWRGTGTCSVQNQTCGQHMVLSTCLGLHHVKWGWTHSKEASKVSAANSEQFQNCFGKYLNTHTHARGFSAHKN